MSVNVVNPFKISGPQTGDITIDGTVQTSSGTTATTDSINITVGANNNRALIVTIAQGSGGDVTSVKIGSTDFTLAKHFNRPSQGSADIWYLLNPPTGLQTVDLVFAISGLDFGWGVLSLFHVAQVSPIGATAENGGNSVGPQPNGAITPTNTGAMIIDSLGSITTSQPLASLTQNYNLFVDVNNYVISQYDLTPTISSSNSMAWSNFTGGFEWTWVAVEIKTD